MSKLTTNDKIRIHGIYLNGPLKGKEIEGKLNIELNIDSIKPGRKSSDSGFNSLMIIILLLLGLNAIVFNRPDTQSQPSTPKVSHQELPQSVNDQVSAYQAN